MTKAEQHGQENQWTSRGRLDRIAGKPASANPYDLRTRQAKGWLQGWLWQEAMFKEKQREVEGDRAE